MQTPERLSSERSVVPTAPVETMLFRQKCPLASSSRASSGWKLPSRDASEPVLMPAPCGTSRPRTCTEIYSSSLIIPSLLHMCSFWGKG